MSGRQSFCHRPRLGFTLIEILVVVAIIALLIAILLPSLAQAKERAKAAVCMSNLKNIGIGCTSYANCSQGRLPRLNPNDFKYRLLDAIGGNFETVNYASVFPRFIPEPEVFWCPSTPHDDRSFTVDGPRGARVFKDMYAHRKAGDPAQKDTSNASLLPIGAYYYALPALAGLSPQDVGRDIYKNSMTDGSRESTYHMYMTDPADITPEQAASFLGPFPPGTRGKYPLQAVLLDSYTGGYRPSHFGGHNTLFSDWHVNWVPDPKGRLKKDWGGEQSYSKGWVYNRGKSYMAWDYHSKHP